jgi:hypothetical protein
MTQEELEELEESWASNNETVKLEDLVKHEPDGVTTSNTTFVEETLKSLHAGLGTQGDGEARDECPLCLDIMEAPVLVPPCMHKWCANGVVLVNFGRLPRFGLQL